MKAKDLASRIFKTHLEKNRLATTYLITGQRSRDRETLAMELACALQCEEKNYFKSCECNACERVRNSGHPDVRWIQDPEARSIKIETIMSRIGSRFDFCSGVSPSSRLTALVTYES